MAENDPAETNAEPDSESASASKDRRAGWLELFKVVALPLVTLILGWVFNASLNARQEKDTKVRLYTEMMGKREESDSALRKDMFNSILSSFMSKDPKLKPDEQLDQEVLNLELLAYNFHESLDLGPLFKHVRRLIPDEQKGQHADMRKRLEKVAYEVIGRQLTVLSDSGMVEGADVSFVKKPEFQADTRFGVRSVVDPSAPQGMGSSRVCLSLDSSDGDKHYRQFKLEVIMYDPLTREVQVRMYVSKILSPADCQRYDLDVVEKREIDTTFWVGLFDFPMIDNTHLTQSERCAVALTQMTDYDLNIALAYFPGSRASLKDKPYYDDLMHDLLNDQHSPGHAEH
jgi:hypothetical protein